MRVACDGGLNTDLGIKMAGDHSDVRFSVALGSNSTANATVDWDVTGTADGQPLIADGNSTDAKTLWRLVRGLSKAVLVWNNLTGGLQCIDVHQRPCGYDNGNGGHAVATAPPPSPRPPPPPPTCTARDKVPSWESVVCNEHWNQVNTGCPSRPSLHAAFGRRFAHRTGHRRGATRSFLRAAGARARGRALGCLPRHGGGRVEAWPRRSVLDRAHGCGGKERLGSIAKLNRSNMPARPPALACLLRTIAPGHLPAAGDRQ